MESSWPNVAGFADWRKGHESINLSLGAGKGKEISKQRSDNLL